MEKDGIYVYPPASTLKSRDFADLIRIHECYMHAKCNLIFHYPTCIMVRNAEYHDISTVNMVICRNSVKMNKVCHAVTDVTNLLMHIIS